MVGMVIYFYFYEMIDDDSEYIMRNFLFFIFFFLRLFAVRFLVYIRQHILLLFICKINRMDDS